MATTVTSNFSGDAAKGYISAALLSGKTLSEGAISIHENVKYKKNLRILDTDSLVQDASCDFATQGNLSLTERVLEPKHLKVNLQLCKADFVPSFEAYDMGASNHENMPSELVDAIMAQIGGKVGEATEQAIWSGTAGAGSFAGFDALLTADATVADVSTPLAITSSNVIAEMGRVIDAIPSALYGKEDMTLYVSQNVYRAYVRALGGFATAGFAPNLDINANSFEGVRLFVANGLADNRMVAAQAENMAFGTSLTSDLNEVKLIDMADIDGSDNFRLVMKYSAGVQYAKGDEIVFYAG